MPDLGVAQEEVGVKRTRKRLDLFKFDHSEVSERIKSFYDDDTSARSDEVDARIQRYAKYRMWREDRSMPWDDAFDVALPDLATHSLRIQDTLHNAVMTMRPCISAVPTGNKSDDDKARKIDDLIDYQVFSENNGENFIGDCADAFVNDGDLTIYIPWVKEDRDVVTIKEFDPIPDEELPGTYFKSLVMNEYPKHDLYKRDEDGWEWEVEEEEETVRISFFTDDDGEVEMVIRRSVTAFNGPRPTVLDWEDVLHPARCENLQPPGPSNPLGAPHVIVLSYPQLDEIKRLKRSGFYNILTDEGIAALENVSGTVVTKTENQEEKIQKDRMSGKTPEAQENKESHKQLTRIMCFDRYDVDGDGLDEDVIWWMILETKTMLKACYLTEMFPADPPRRPFAEAGFIPVRGRRQAISLLELLESLHDFMKQLTDQTGDAGMMANQPFGFYRASSNIKQETIRIQPGTLFPVSDPANDVYFPQLQGQSQAFGLNMLTIFGGFEDKLAMQSDLQFGRVPAGQASALRTAGGQQTLLAQGEARPERILRRFFVALTEVWAQIHELNQRFLPDNKRFRITGYDREGTDPYQEITKREEIAGRFQFTFKANVLNSSKQALQQSLMQLVQLYISPIAIQSGNVGPDEIRNMLRDVAKAWGQDAETKGYLRPLPPGMEGPPISAEIAITAMLNFQQPMGRPMEGAQMHLQKLIEFAKSDDFGQLSGDEVTAFTKLFAEYMQKISMLAEQEARQMQLAQAAQGLFGGGQGGTPAAPPDTGTQQLSPNELVDETLPSAKGGNA